MPSVLKVFPWNQVKTKTETDWDVLPLFSFLSILFFFCPLRVFFCLGPDAEPTEVYEKHSHCLPKAPDQAPGEDEYMP